MAKKKSKSTSNKITAALGLESKPWLTADEIPKDMGAAEDRHAVLGLILLYL